MGSRKFAWAVLVGETLHQRIQLSELAPDLYPLEYLPEIHATEQDLTEAQARLGHPLDSQHAAVLARINGWRDGLPDGDLLSTNDLGQGPAWRRVHEILAEHYALDAEYRKPDSPAPVLPDPTTTYPFLYTEFNNDPRVAVIERMPSADPDDGAPVHLIGEGTVLETWPTFYEFWASQIAVLRKDVEEFRSTHARST